MKHFAIGDIHGRFDLLSAALEAIGDLEEQNARLVFLGDYIDRGPQSREVVEALMAISISDRVICLRGNHEELMVDGLCGDAMDRMHWLSNGGRAALASYGGDVPQAHLDWVRNRPVCYETDTHFFVHAGVRPGVPLDRQDPAEMVWIRGLFLDSRADFGKHVVHGHTPDEEPELRLNRTNLDTGAFHTGRLTVGVFEGPGGPTEVWAVREDGITKTYPTAQAA